MRAGGGERFREAAQQRLDQVRQGGSPIQPNASDEIGMPSWVAAR